MNKEDKKIKKLLKRSAPEVPSSIQKIFDGTMHRQKRIYKSHILIASLIVLMIIIPNLSPQLSYALQDIPLLGKIFTVTSIHKKAKHVDIDFPQVNVKGTQGNSSLNTINKSVKDWTQMCLDQFEKENGETKYADMQTTYKVITNTKTWFTLKLKMLVISGDSDVALRYYSIDKRDGKIKALHDIFKENYDYKSSINKEIKKQIRERSLNDDQIYWDFDSIEKDQKFYFNKKNELVIVFDKFEIAPAYMGEPEFVIPHSLVQPYLK